MSEVDTTAEFKVNLTRPITPKTGASVCEGKVVHKGVRWRCRRRR